MPTKGYENVLQNWKWRSQVYVSGVLHDSGESLQFGSQHNDLHGLLDPLSITAAETARKERHNLPTNIFDLKDI